jgi:hypothetical protein
VPHSQHVRATALVGRRIDAPGADPPRFPLDHVANVRDRLRDLISEYQPDWLVSSAACGSDLIAQQVAGELARRRRVVLPFSPQEFRQRSVIDRPGDWGPAFDRLILELEREKNVLNLQLDPEAPDVYTRANEAILEQALALAGGATAQVLAVIVWEGQARGDDDYTAAFATVATQRGMVVKYVLTN